MGRVLRADYLGHGPRVVPRTAYVRQEFGKHTLAVVDYRITGKAEYVLPGEGAPAVVRYGLDGQDFRPFYGYVNHYEGATEDGTTLRVVMLGTSRRMSDAAPTTWTNLTNTGIAREYAKRHRLRSLIHPHDFERTSWSSHTLTDFQSLNVLADEIGFRCWVDGPTVYMLDPRRIMKSPQSAPLFFGGETLRKIQVTGGANAPRDEGPLRKSVVYGLDKGTDTLLVATGGSHDNPTRIEARTADTYAEAEWVAAASERKSLDFYTVEMTVVGDSRIVPGAVVGIRANNPATDQQGYWMVTRATHRVTSREYLTDVVGVRGSDQMLSTTVPTVVRGAKQFDGAVVRDGKNWEAILQEHLSV